MPFKILELPWSRNKNLEFAHFQNVPKDAKNLYWIIAIIITFSKIPKALITYCAQNSVNKPSKVTPECWCHDGRRFTFGHGQGRSSWHPPFSQTKKMKIFHWSFDQFPKSHNRTETKYFQVFQKLSTNEFFVILLSSISYAKSCILAKKRPLMLHVFNFKTFFSSHLVIQTKQASGKIRRRKTILTKWYFSRCFTF